MPALTVFPVALDSYNNIGAQAVDQPNPQGEVHSFIHAQLIAAIAAIEAKLGIDGSLVTTSLTYMLRAGLGGVVALVDAATIATNAALGSVFDVTIAADRILGAPTNPSDGQLCTWRIKQGPSGSHLLTYNAVFNFGSIGAPTLSTVAGKIDHIIARYNGSTSKWEVELVVIGF